MYENAIDSFFRNNSGALNANMNNPRAGYGPNRRGPRRRNPGGKSPLNDICGLMQSRSGNGYQNGGAFPPVNFNTTAFVTPEESIMNGLTRALSRGAI